MDYSPPLIQFLLVKKLVSRTKESIICGWDIINKNLKKYKTKFIPIDSEHFSINQLIAYEPKKY